MSKKVLRFLEFLCFQVLDLSFHPFEVFSDVGK